MRCRDFKELADSYLSNELLVETNHDVLKHLENCPECRAVLSDRREVRTRLRRAVRAATESSVPLGYVQQTTRKLHAQAFGKGLTRFYFARPAIIAAAAVLVIAIAVSLSPVFNDDSTEVSSRKLNDTKIEATPARWFEKVSFLAAKDDAIDDHRHCALSHNLKEKPVSLKEAEKRFGMAADGLDSMIVDALHGFPSTEARLIKAHFCMVNGRRFLHVVVEHNRKVLSILLTQNEEGGPAANDDPVSCGADGELNAACFETNKNSVFVISDLNEEENMLVAKTIVPTVRAFYRA